MNENGADPRELRAAARYAVDSRLSASFGALEVNIVDLSEHGVQLQHSESIRLGSTARFLIMLPDKERIAIRALIIWSHLSQKAMREGLPPYSSGARFEDDDPGMARRLVDRLLERRLASPLAESLAEKQRKEQQKERDRRQNAQQRRVFVTPISSDQLLMINHARERLRTNPDEARKWYQRARYALLEDESRTTEAPTHYREDVLAVWEYLERTIDIATIEKVFERHLR